MIYLFLIGSISLIYHLLLYPLLLMIFSTRSEKVDKNKHDLPAVSVICPAFNEEISIKEKIESFLNLNYPSEKLEFYIISDGSSDTTEEIIKNYKKANIHLIKRELQSGKSSAFEAVLPLIKTDLILATDANSLFHPDAVLELVDSMNSDSAIGMVVGKLEYVHDPNDTGEIMYWNYETWLKGLENRFNSVICANGSLYLIRKEYLCKLDPAAADDFERTLIVLERKGKVIFNPLARVKEIAYSDLRQLIRAKTRNITRQWVALSLHRQLLNPLRHPKIAFQLFSHKILRWLLPFFSSMILISSLGLTGDVWRMLLAAQVLLYLAGLFAILIRRTEKIPILLRYCGYWMAMNIASLRAFVLFSYGYRFTRWNTCRTEGKIL